MERLDQVIYSSRVKGAQSETIILRHTDQARCVWQKGEQIKSMRCVGIQKHELWLEFQTHGFRLLEIEAARKDPYGRRETAQQMPEVLHSSAIGIHDDSVFRIHKHEFLPGIGVKLTKVISLFSLAKPINYPSLLELIFAGLDNTFFPQRLKKESDYAEGTAENLRPIIPAASRVANPQVDSTQPHDTGPP
jgi:hypothetical protein